MTVASDRVTEFLEGVRRNRREIVTPEAVSLPVDLAEHGGRAVAFAIDLFIWLCATILLYLVIVLALRQGASVGIVMTLVLFIAFLVRNLYFIYFELMWRGATPGKRICGLRVIDRRGGPLTPAAVVARNLTREVEIFLPLGALLSLGGGASLWGDLSLTVWLVLLSALPLFNRDRMRGGDFIAGTIVIAVPKRLLLGDLVKATARHCFTTRQLGAYGAFELQVLEELLRRPISSETDRLLADVCAKICRKIEWTTAVPRPEIRGFLTEFYTAERAHLEHEQLFGRARADKNSPPA
jgi:uncharacterized RDD family membrane protein YckC